MNYNTHFLEKDFLVYLLDHAQNSCGNHWYKIKDYQFNVMDTHFTDKFPSLILQIKVGTISRETHQWFKESTSRGFTAGSENNYYYKLTEGGYSQALKYKNPIKTFCKEHWKFLSTLSASFIGLLIAIVRLTKC